MRIGKAKRRELVCDAPPKRHDPTGTGDLRRKYQAAADLRLNTVKARLRQSIIAQNVLGLTQSAANAAALAGSIAGVASLPGSGPDDMKTKGFQATIDHLLDAIFVEGAGEWLRPMIETAYARGVKRAQVLTKTIAAPLHARESVQALVGLCLIELQGIAEATSQHAVRAVALGMIHKAKPTDVSTAVLSVVDKIGRNRARSMVALMLVKAFNTATLDQFEAAGVKKVGVDPEFLPKPRLRDAKKGTGPGSRTTKTTVPSSRTVRRIRAAQRQVEELEEVNVLTAGDDDVCPVCEDIADEGPYDIDTARSLIPAHPNCRCAFIPFYEFDEE